MIGTGLDESLDTIQHNEELSSPLSVRPTLTPFNTLDQDPIIGMKPEPIEGMRLKEIEGMRLPKII